MMKLLSTVVCVLCLLGLLAWLLPAAQAESVHVSEGWFATISNCTSYDYEPGYNPETGEFQWTYLTYEGFMISPQYCLSTTTSVLEPVYLPHDPWLNTTSGVSIHMHDGWVDTVLDRVTASPASCVGDEMWYHVSFDWSTSWSDSPAAQYLTWELWAGTGSGWDVAWRVTHGAGYHQGHVDMDVPLTFIGSPGFALSFNPVPEPSTVLALLCGLGGLTLFSRRRRWN